MPRVLFIRLRSANLFHGRLSRCSLESRNASVGCTALQRRPGNRGPMNRPLSPCLRSSLTHPSLALILGAEVWHGTPFLVFEYLHRDVKPSNIGYALDGTPKLLDFGLARLVGIAWTTEAGATLTAQDDLVGTLLYLSPEALNGAPADRVRPPRCIFSRRARPRCSTSAEVREGNPRPPPARGLTRAPFRSPDVRQQKRDLPDYVSYCIIQFFAI